MKPQLRGASTVLPQHSLIHSLYTFVLIFLHRDILLEVRKLKDVALICDRDIKGYLINVTGIFPAQKCYLSTRNTD